jgi:hypothetical protein
MGITAYDVQPIPPPEESLLGWPLYPVGPLSWLAPSWAYVCGAAASGTRSWNSASLLRLLLGLLLAGPLLVVAWASVQHLAAGNSSEVGIPNPKSGEQTPGASARGGDTDVHDGNDAACLEGDRPAEPAADVTACLPYTLRGSASDRLTTWLSKIWEDWSQTQTQRRSSVVKLATSTLFALVVASHLGRSPVVLTVTAFGLLYGVALVKGRWARSIALSTTLPLLAAWLLGHATYALPSPTSAATGAAFAVALSSGRISTRGAALAAWQFLAQLIAAGLLVTVRQPIAASIVALLAFPSVLLVPLLDQPASRPRYFAAQQLPFMVSMLVAGLALGYRP